MSGYASDYSDKVMTCQEKVVELMNQRTELRIELVARRVALDQWRACAERLAAIVSADPSQHHLADDIAPALAEFQRLKGTK